MGGSLCPRGVAEQSEGSSDGDRRAPENPAILLPGVYPRELIRIWKRRWPLVSTAALLTSGQGVKVGSCPSAGDGEEGCLQSAL